MKMMKNIKFWLASVVFFSMGVTSCIEEGTDEVSGKGTNEFRFETDEFGIVTFLPFTAGQTKTLVTIYRDAVSTGAMDKEVTVSFEINADSLAAYNTANGTDYVLLDPASYTLNINPGTLTFAPNEGAKTIIITLNTTPLNLSEAHVLPFVIKNASDEYELNGGHDLTIIRALPINKYDGEYEVTGDPWVDNVNPDLAGLYPFTWELETTGESSVACFDPDYFGGYFHPILVVSSGGASGYGAFGVELTFDGSDDVESIINIFAPAGNTRDVLYDPNVGLNKWNSGDGSIDITYHMIQPNQALPPPYIRCSFNEHLALVGPR